MAKRTLESTPPQEQAPAFYHNPSVGDIVLRSSDGIEFYLHSDILSATSPFFADMLSLPQPSSRNTLETPTNTPTPHLSGKPVISTHENSAVWEKIIPLCYLPAYSSNFSLATDLTAIGDLLKAADKFDVRAATDAVRASLLRSPLVKQHPLSIYALAWAYKLPDVALLAARRALALPPDEFGALPSEFDTIDASTAYKTLNAYRSDCSKAARVITASGKELTRLMPELCGGDECDSGHKDAPIPPKPSLLRRLSQVSRTDSLKLPGRVKEKSVYPTARTEKSKTFHIYVSSGPGGRRFPWKAYFAELTRVLEFRPHPDLARSQAAKDVLMESIVETWGECAECRGGPYRFLVDVVVDMVRNEIEGAIAKVRRQNNPSVFDYT